MWTPEKRRRLDIQKAEDFERMCYGGRTLKEASTILHHEQIQIIREGYVVGGQVFSTLKEALRELDKTNEQKNEDQEYLENPDYLDQKIQEELLAIEQELATEVQSTIENR